jgi:hypothetical protein
MTFIPLYSDQSGANCQGVVPKGSTDVDWRAFAKGPSNEVMISDFLREICQSDRADGVRKPNYDSISLLMRACKPRTVLILDPTGLRESYAVLNSLSEQIMTVVCRSNSAHAVGLKNGQSPINLTREQLLSPLSERGQLSDDQKVKSLAFASCFDLIIVYHDGSDRIARQVIPLLSKQGLCAEVFIDNFHQSEIVTTWSRAELVG